MVEYLETLCSAMLQELGKKALNMRDSREPR